jgi:hypothetical protein
MAAFEEIRCVHRCCHYHRRRRRSSRSVTKLESSFKSQT